MSDYQNEPVNVEEATEPQHETRYYADGTSATGLDLPDESPAGAPVVRAEPKHQAGLISSQTPTPFLRTFEGKLQQMWNVVRRHLGGESSAHQEWRDIPEHVEPEVEDTDPNAPTGQVWDDRHRDAISQQNAERRVTGAPSPGPEGDAARLDATRKAQANRDATAAAQARAEEHPAVQPAPAPWRGDQLYPTEPEVA